MFMLHLPEEKRREVLGKAPWDSANFERVTEVVFTGGGVDVREYMKENLDMALRSMHSQKGDGPCGNERQPLGPPAQRWGGGPLGWRNEPDNQGNWRNDREAGGNRALELGNSRWKDARDGRWGDPPQPRAMGARPEVSQARTPPPSGAPATTGTPPQVTPRPNNPPPRSGCVYCNEEGYIKRECPYLTEALRLGVVKLNENKWVVWGDDREAVSFYPSMKVNVDKRIALQEARLEKKFEIGSTSNSSRVQMTESLGGVSIREPQVSSIKFVETQPGEEGPCLRVRTQVGAGPSKGKESATDGGGRRNGDDDQPMVDAKGTEERKGEEPTSPKSPRKKGAKKFEMKCTLDEIDMVAPLRRTLMQPMQCTLLEYLAVSKSARDEFLSITKKVRIPLAGGPTVPGDGLAQEGVQSSRITMEELPANFFAEEEAKRFYVLGSDQLQAVVSGKKMRALVDNGSESTVCRDSIARELGLKVNKGVSMSMVVADNKLQPAEGVCHNPMIEVAGVEATVPDGSQTLSIQSPDGIRVVLKAVDAQDERNRTSIPRRKEAQSRVCQVRLEESPFDGKEPPGDRLDVEDVRGRVVIDGVGYENEDEEEELGGYVRLSFLEESP
ncbi:hypothetical protein CBR_g32039 [Chara braunii]|uniref:CCHC-type domain-containing protein n=1 Tax=Chara braunii TaxID=69332 RepID=A0A388LGC7_CHABU|nr:hypothetical protein CBR_g32039 [Chara braunii]|eukprot:GBG81366.1 hypothetical protein CBR_g32039 [Chara braunii]